MELLDNARWGFESNCFVCEPSNEHGLRIPFFHDEERSVVTATFALEDRFSGAPTWVHGGVVLAVLDEAMAWATIALAGRFAATRETSATFERALLVGRRYTVDATVGAVGDETIETDATIADEKGRPCTTAHATFTVLGEAQAARAIGGDVTPAAASYVVERGGGSSARRSASASAPLTMPDGNDTPPDSGSENEIERGPTCREQSGTERSSPRAMTSRSSTATRTSRPRR